MTKLAQADDQRPDGPKAVGRERRCVVARQVMPEAELIRFAIGPEGEVVPDLGAKLPGRGVWVEARRAAVETAAKKNLFAQSAKRKVAAPTGLADQVEAQLAARCLAQLGLARRGGGAVIGFDQVRALLKSEAPAYMIEASDGAADGRTKLLRLARAAWGEVPLAGAFTAAELGAALGREAAGHVALVQGPAARGFAAEFKRLSGFRSGCPASWSKEEG
ncbi:MAG: RNA-binding protein [Maricaulaceae bacterium]|jgi:predicted RNA-binding protein YlxR (DUF448 family)